jgi:adenosylmethionine-8-amino-7-oxononanoate aminotransferase
VANASINLLVNLPWQDDIARIEKHFYAELAPLKQNDIVADVRILGAIGIIEMVNDIEVEKTQNQLIDNGETFPLLHKVGKGL